MELVVKPVEAGELDRVWTAVREAVAYMGELGNPQWNESYPTRRQYQDALEAGTLFGAYMEGELAGVMVLDGEQAPEYADLTWTTPQNALVIHKMAVRRQAMGRGVAAALFRFAGEEALRQGRGGLRGDTYQRNAPMRHIFQARGFTYVGAVHFPGHQPGEYLCFEKKV